MHFKEFGIACPSNPTKLYFKSNQIKSNQIKSNQIKSNQIKSNQIKSNQISGKISTQNCKKNIYSQNHKPNY